ncbi:MAG: hypothetical protein RI932_1593 [Pseudomonadota bacterium]
MLQSITVLLATAILSSCSLISLTRKQPLILDAPAGVELVVYRQVGKSGQRVMSPVGLVRGGQSLELEPGEYLVANECSGYAFKQTRDKPTKIPVRRLSLVLHGERVNQPSESAASVPQIEATPEAELTAQVKNEPEANVAIQAAQAEKPTENKTAAQSPAPTELSATVHTLCVDPLDAQRNEWKNRREFDILPGTTEFRIGGRLVKIENHGENSDKILLDLYPVTIVSTFQDNDARFYLTPEEKEPKSESSVVGMSANGSSWLLPGEYSLEVNGTRRKLSIERGALTEISVGVLRIDMPKNFPMEDRLRAGGQPVFVYLDTGALLNMDTDYLVFPGSYKVSIEGSEVQDEFLVEAGLRTVVKTFAARVDVPPCPESFKSCRNPPGVTIHREQKPYALMTVEPKLPFILLEGAYEYGVEGLRGIKRNLQRRSDALAGEPLARVKIKWDVRQAQGRFRTDLVRIESRGTNVFGRSLDLLFHKPEEVYVPAGSYDLTYFLGDPLGDRVKTRQSLMLEPGQTREVVVPIYLEKVNRPEDTPNPGLVRGAAAENSSTKKSGNSRSTDSEESPAAQQLPQSLTPLRR